VQTTDTVASGGSPENGPVVDPTVPVEVVPPQDADEASEFGPVRYVARAVLTVLAITTLSFVLFLTLGSRLEHWNAQTKQFDRFRGALALGTAPVGQLTPDGKKLLALGTPVADLRIPSIHLHQVVGEGTTGQVLTMGPGHLRYTALPGQPGTSVIFGRAGTFGGPFKHLSRLHRGAIITTTTGAGKATFKVVDVRRAGDKVPPPPAHGSRLILTTTQESTFVPGGLLYVDADQTSKPLPPSSSVLTANDVRSSEKANATDTGNLWKVVLLLEALVVLAVGAVWAWVRWGRYQTWIVFVPLLLVVNLLLSDQLILLLPNLT